MTTTYESPARAELPEPIRDAMADAEHGKVVYLTHAGVKFAAVVPLEVAAAGAAAVTAAIEALEDAEDIAAAKEAKAEGGPRYSHESIKAELGLI